MYVPSPALNRAGLMSIITSKHKMPSAFNGITLVRAAAVDEICKNALCIAFVLQHHVPGNVAICLDTNAANIDSLNTSMV